MSKEHNKKTLKGDALVNKVALIVIEVISIALILGYISDFLVGNASIVYFVVFEIAAVLSAIIIPITYKKKPEKMKYIAFACFSLVYLIALYRPTIDLIFVTIIVAPRKIPVARNSINKMELLIGSPE